MGKFLGWWRRPATTTTTCEGPCVRQPSSSDINVDRVRAALLARSLAGFRKYGTTTERTDVDTLGWLQHLQEELLDAAVYVERLKEEFRQRKIVP
jgi:hypothetical protein